MGFFSRLVNGLKNTKKSFSEKMKYIFTGNDIDEDFFEELEYILISADIGAVTAEEILDELRDRIKAQKIKKAPCIQRIFRRHCGNSCNNHASCSHRCHQGRVYGDRGYQRRDRVCKNHYYHHPHRR